ncbi:MAG: AtpZ/AtpI family protein [Candidatus Acidiferrales bacterium]
MSRHLVMDPNSSRKDRASAFRQMALAFQIPFTLVMPVFVAGGIGYLLDRWLHTKFILMIVLGFIGFGIGLWDVIKSANAAEKKNGE